MASLPYPSFVNDVPVGPQRSALVAAGRCRIHPQESKAYQSLVALNVQQADEETDKKLKKKYMKQGVAQAKEYLQKLQLDVSIVDVEVVLRAQDVIRTDGCLASCFLDAGCATIVMDGTNTEGLDAAKIPKERLMAVFKNEEQWKEHAEKVKELCAAVSIKVTSNVTAANLKAIISSDKEIHIVVEILSSNAIDTLIGSSESDNYIGTLVGAVCKGASARNGTIALIDPSAAQLGLAYAACIVTDRSDGLFTTVVCSRTGEALGLVYSSPESIVAALECGRGVYYSRSRHGLWRKGDTSGHIQQLHRLDVDCDGDALRFTVTQKSGSEKPPAFCHLNTYTCWGPPRGLSHLEETMNDRLKSAPEGSYTKRLFDDPQLLRDKLVEEAQELSEADTPDHVAEELADVLYFAMARAAKAGVSIDDAVAELDRRARKVTRRQGDSKAFRIAAGKAILEKKGES